MDVNDDDIGNIQFVEPLQEEVIVGKPISSEWKPIPPIGTKVNQQG